MPTPESPFNDSTEATEEELELLRQNTETDADPEPDVDNEDFQARLSQDEVGGDINVDISPPSRKDKKNERLNQYREMEKEVQRTREEMAEMRGQINAVASRPVVAPPAAPQGPQEDPYQPKLDALFERKQGVYQTFAAEKQAGSLTAERQAELATKIRKLEDEEFDVKLERSGRGQAPAVNETVVAERAAIVAKFPDIMASPKTQAYARATYDQLIAGGRQGGWATMEEAAEQTRRHFKMKTAEPTQSQRNAHTGIPRGGSQAQKGSTRRVAMTAERKALADAAYSHILDDKERWATWAKNVGAELED